MAKWCNKPIPNADKGMVIPIDETKQDIAELVLVKMIKKINHRNKMSWLKLLGQHHLKVLTHTRKRFGRNYGKH